jgi:hypothetical protein
VSVQGRIFWRASQQKRAHEILPGCYLGWTILPALVSGVNVNIFGIGCLAAGLLLMPALPARAATLPEMWDWTVRDFEVVMRTHGEVSFAPYVHGESPEADFFPGYRSDFFTYVDFFSWKGLVSS